MKTVLMLADQMIGRIEYVHNKNFIHRYLIVLLDHTRSGTYVLELVLLPTACGTLVAKLLKCSYPGVCPKIFFGGRRQYVVCDLFRFAVSAMHSYCTL
jgi:hypothetical protein